MKNIPFLFILLIVFGACSSSDYENYQKYSAFTSMKSTVVPDSATLGDTVLIAAEATAPNGCWSDINLYLTQFQSNDKQYKISATGTFESFNGICSQGIITNDTIFKFLPDSAGNYIFVTFSLGYPQKSDTLIVTEELNNGSI